MNILRVVVVDGVKFTAELSQAASDRAGPRVSSRVCLSAGLLGNSGKKVYKLSARETPGWWNW